MRQARKEIREQAVLEELLFTCVAGRLGTMGSDGYPMIKPVNFAYHDRKIFIHSAREGEKIEHIKRDSRVCFETDMPIALIKSQGSPCRTEYLYRSVIMKGRAYIVDDNAERLFGLQLLMKKYQPEGGYGNFPEEKLRITAVVKIDIEEMTGKEDLGEGSVNIRIREALEKKMALPMVLIRE
jgi:uncharacterized protein